ncbi:MAG: amidohydrolase [Alphaproteobacteria bacterium]|nr:amidohydrolase [Alphaproteobacteria bacterium]
MADLIIANAYVVTMDAKRHMYSDGAIAIAGNKIVGVGPTEAVRAKHRAAHVIDGSGMMAIPGLIDGHLHPNQYLSNGIGDDIDIMSWLYKRIYPYEAVLTPEDAYLSALGGFVEAIRYGTTCFNDPGGIHADAMAQAAVDIGIRGIMNRSTRDIHDPIAPLPKSLIENTQQNLDRGEAFVKKWHHAEGDRIRAWFSLRYVYNISDELAVGIGKLARKYKVGVHAHAAAVKGENEAIQKMFGKRSLERYYDLGLFGPNLYLVHMGWTNEREIGWLAKHGCKVAHCPGATMFGAYGVFGNGMMPKMADAGITISLGTDSASASGNLDMIRVMYLAACGHKDIYNDATLWGAYKALEMATIDGAKALLWDDAIGSLEAGKKADVTLVDMKGIEFANHPGREPVRALVYSATGKSVDTVIIDGRIVLRHGALLTIDEEDVKRRLAAASRAWRKRAGLTLRPPWPVIRGPRPGEKL